LNAVEYFTAVSDRPLVDRFLSRDRVRRGGNYPETGGYRRRSTIITTNLEYEEWHNFLGNKALVDALLSRLRHQCHTIRIDGPSLREPQG
jgi:hypothetical protein